MRFLIGQEGSADLCSVQWDQGGFTASGFRSLVMEAILESLEKGSMDTTLSGCGTHFEMKSAIGLMENVFLLGIAHCRSIMAV